MRSITNRFKYLWLSVIFLFIYDSGGLVLADDALHKSHQQIQTLKGLAAQNLAFTKNEGQWDERIFFRANAGGATMWFARDGAYYQFNRRIPKNRHAGNEIALDKFHHEPDSIETMMIKASFIGTNYDPEMVGEEILEYKCNYFIGNDPDKWRTDVPNYKAVVYEDIYAGIDLKYYGNNKQMEYDFIVSPGADPTVSYTHLRAHET